MESLPLILLRVEALMQLNRSQVPHCWMRVTGMDTLNGREFDTITRHFLVSITLPGEFLRVFSSMWPWMAFPSLGLDPDFVFDECNFDVVNMLYHVRSLDQVDDSLPYCNGTDEAVNWNYILGCYRGAALHDSTITSLPADCVSVADPSALFAAM